MNDPLSKLYSQVLAPEIPLLADAQQQLLRHQIIDENSPGTILRDFQTLLDYLHPKGTEVSGVHNLLPFKILPELNSYLSHPIDIRLKRPQQKSYPYINGLYLLLRASGLSQIKHSGKKQILVLDETVLQNWKTLNPTSRYFTLLEAWMIWGNSEILGERYDSLGNLLKCLRFWVTIPDKGLKIAKSTDQQSFTYYPELYNIALLDLFGFLSIQSGKPEAGKGWRITRLQRLPFGDAMLSLLFTIHAKKGFAWSGENNVNITFGELQAEIKPLFPGWEHNLIIPESDFTQGIYIFKVSLGKAWRRIAIPTQLELERLSSIILDAFDFDNDHLYRFSYRDRFGRTIQVNHPYCEEPPFTTEVCIGDLSLQVGERMIFLFDFGDNWKFDVQLEQINLPDAKIKKPKILETHGQAPKQYGSEEDDWEEDEDENEEEDG